MISALHKQPDGTIRLTIIIPSDTVKKTWDEVVEEVAKNLEIAGFRKGKAPKHLVEEKLDKAKIKQEVLKKLLPQYYLEAIKEQNINPIMSPRIHVEKIEDLAESKDWQFTALTCEMPEIKLNNYKQDIQQITAKSKIIVPGREKQEVKFDDIVKELLDSITTTIPQILIDQEVERLLAQTLDDIKRLGLTLDQYLSSTNRTPQGLRDEYKKKVINDIKLEFALQKIAKDEHITVEEKEIEEAIQKAKDPDEKKHLENNRYLLANILRQQKSLDFLKNL